MNKIPGEIVEKTWREMVALSPDYYPKLVNKFTEEQPVILAYFLTISEEHLNEDEQHLFLYVALVVWRIMSKGEMQLPRVTKKMIREATEKNLKMLEYLHGESESGFIETVEIMIENYNQPEVLQFVVEALIEEDEEDNGHIRNESIGMMMIYLKTVIDCFDK